MRKFFHGKQRYDNVLKKIKFYVKKQSAKLGFSIIAIFKTFF